MEPFSDPIAAFLEAASVDRHGGHRGGTLDQADQILRRHPHVAGANIYTAAVLGDAAAVRGVLDRDRSRARALATTSGGPFEWDPLTYLCFSRFLRLDRSRADGFVDAARLLLEAGADANARWHDTIDEPPRPVPETLIYGAGGLAQDAALTRLLLEFGADPNDEETPYHVPETYDNTVLEILLESGRFNERSLATVLARKADWHDEAGLALALAHGANPNFMTAWKHSPFQHAIRRDNALSAIERLLAHGADPLLRNDEDHRNAFAMAAYHGRGDLLDLFSARGFGAVFDAPLDRLVAACASGNRAAADTVLIDAPDVLDPFLTIGGSLLSRFAGVGNLAGVRTLLALGVPVDAPWPEGDPYWELAKHSTALHVAAWRARHDIVTELIARGANVHAIDGRGRTPLQLAVRACVDSHWTSRRQPDSVAALLAAGATADGIALPSGYAAIDALFR